MCLVDGKVVIFKKVQHVDVEGTQATNSEQIRELIQQTLETCLING